MTDRAIPSLSTREAVRSRNLRARALDAAARQIAAKGPDAVHLRDIATELGTGPASLYYHFDSKDALLAEVAAAGFRSLESAVVAGYEDGRERPPIQACGDAYLHFIRDNIMLYQVMYSERLLAAHAISREAERKAFATFARLIALEDADAADLQNIALTLWALGRGIAALAITSDETEAGSGRELGRRIVRGLEALMGRRVSGAARQHGDANSIAESGSNPAGQAPGAAAP